jgi:ferredoxin
MFATVGAALGGLLSLTAARTAKAVVQKHFVSTQAPNGYDPTKHKWLMCFDVDRCIGCGLCVEACKTENNVPQGPTYFRTWIERYIIKKPKPGSDAVRGEVLVDSPNGGRADSAAFGAARGHSQRFFRSYAIFNTRRASGMSGGATFDTPRMRGVGGPNYCIAADSASSSPIGCRFMNWKMHTAEKCTLCYHRITRD